MSTKHDNPCLIKAGDDEPIFVLRARDVLAPDLVNQWARQLYDQTGEADKPMEAERLAEEMRHWQARNGSKLPD